MSRHVVLLLLPLLLLLPISTNAFMPATPFRATFVSRAAAAALFGSREEDLFSNHCDPGGFMTRETLAKVPTIAEMLVRL